MICDGHIHTHFCPHGSNDHVKRYIERGIALGYKEMSFTEHAPLPTTFNDPVPGQDSAMDISMLEDYLNEMKNVKREYQKDIQINIGLEVDYIEGYEEETRKLLNDVGSLLDDSILSVHFLKLAGDYFCVDYSDEEFAKIAKLAGSTDKVYERYFQTVMKSVRADLGTFKPRRIGHMTLVTKFQKKYPPKRVFDSEIYSILDEVKEQNLQLDYNGAGSIKPLCLEPYPPAWVVDEAINRGIPLVYGSDAHSANGLGQGLTSLVKGIALSSPTASSSQS